MIRFLMGRGEQQPIPDRDGSDDEEGDEEMTDQITQNEAHQAQAEYFAGLGSGSDEEEKQPEQLGGDNPVDSGEEPGYLTAEGDEMPDLTSQKSDD